MLVNHSQLGEIAGCEFQHLTPAYIDNLCRLGLAEVPSMFQYTSKGVYDNLENSAIVQKLKTDIETNPEFRVVLERRGLRITELGKQFAGICVARKV